MKTQGNRIFKNTCKSQFDRFNRLEQWQWGDQLERYSYKRHGLIDEIHSKQDGATKFSYNELHLVRNSSLFRKARSKLSYF